ncbi:Glutathione transport system permease protein gsiC [Alloiococcus otitis]|uniref:ABC transmembrane type-1 domain-containing protein n=1 Tax=Alloiococcus otitis ATCC 51267 TaxID=883081 RepID=K9EY53_9LACT|nr:ABC transporter permease [Alloiococcus otitis]EKU94165.1 hypothetical protein HMPREF9698_00197 [Alloiococcus otitis ATCC 51267]SUU81202.1 Glutathione transport system permease protein gsiC [Alloiococcus otitis]
MKIIVKKIMTTIVTLLLVSIIIFLMFNVLPGNPAQSILGIDADPAQIQNLEIELGLDRNLLERYFEWLVNLFSGDLGISYRYQQPVADIISSRLPVTVSLTIYSFVITLIFAIPLGLFISRYEGTMMSTIVSLITQLGISTPSFWLGFLLIYFFAYKLNLFPTFGYIPFRDNFVGGLQSLFLPSLAIAISNIAVIIRYLSNSVSDQLSQDYVTTAMVKGASDGRIMYRHVLKNASLPVITIIGLMVADTLGGSIIIENVFALPGLGSLLNASVESRDFPLIQSLVMFISIIIIVTNLVVDIVYNLIDPRIKLGGK